MYVGAGELRVQDVEDPRPGSTADAVVAIHAAGICGSDLHQYRAPRPFNIGFCVGHEAIGEVVETGSQVRRWRPGDRVLIPPGARCDGTCDGCRAGTACQHPPRPYGLSAELPGSQADLLHVPMADANLLRLPPDISPDNALLLTDCAMTAWYGAQRAAIPRGGSVAVIGLGPIGLVAVMVAHVLGASEILAIDPVAGRRDRARALGAATATPDDARELAHELLRTRPHSVIEAAGTPDAVRLALDLVRPRGTVSVIGVAGSDAFAFPLAATQMKEVDFRVGLARYVDLPGLLDLVATGRIDPAEVISHRFPLDRGPDAYALANAPDDDVCKVVLDVQRER